MEKVANELRLIVSTYSEKLKTLSDDEFSAKPNPGKWSKKEVIGHLIDSAQNNLRRLVVGQYDTSTVVIYDQDFWVNANAYQEMNSQDIILLWKLMNERIASVLVKMSPEHYSNELNTGKDVVEMHSLEWLAADYVRHLKHHLNQVFANEFNIVYP